MLYQLTVHAFCREHRRYEDYRELLPKMTDEELSNMAVCLCHQVDKALTSYIEKKDREFTTEGGIRERMTAARMEQRFTQKERIAQLEKEVCALRTQLAAAQAEIERLRGGEVMPGADGQEP